MRKKRKNSQELPTLVHLGLVLTGQQMEYEREISMMKRKEIEEKLAERLDFACKMITISKQTVTV